MKTLKRALIIAVFFILFGLCYGCAGTSTWGMKDGDADLLPDNDGEPIEYSEEIPDEFDAENDEEGLEEFEANFEQEDYAEELLEAVESEEIEESNEFKLPTFLHNLNTGNTEGTVWGETLYSSILSDNSTIVVWHNELGIRFNTTNQDYKTWRGEKLLLTSLQSSLKEKIAPPLQYCLSPTPDCHMGEPMPSGSWNVDISPLIKDYGNNFRWRHLPHMNVWTDGDFNVHIPISFSVNANNEGLLDLSLKNDTTNYQIAVLEDLGKDYNDAFLLRMQNGLEPSDANTPRLGMGTFFDWGAAPGGCGVLYGVTGDSLDMRIDWYNALYERTYCNGNWSERRRIFTMGDAPGTLDDENDQVCSCSSDRTGCSCKDIWGIYPVKNGLNEIIDPVILEVWWGGNKPGMLIAVWANEEPVKSQIIIDSKSDYDRMPNRIYGVYAFDDGQTWMALGVWETDRFNVKIVPFDENGFKFDNQIKLFEILPRDTPNIPGYVPEAYLKSSLGQQPNGRVLSFIRDETAGVSGGRLVEYKHVHDANGDTVVELTANNPPWLDQTGIMGETILIPDNNGKSILITERLRHPFDLNITKGEGGPSYRDICVYAQNDQGIRENIGCPINSEGFHWSYGSPAWLEGNPNELPVLLMGGGGGNGYFSMIDAADESHIWKMFPYSQIVPSGTRMSAGLNGARDLVAATSSELETLLLRLDSERKLKTNKIIHSDDIQKAGCGVMSVAGDLLRFRCRGSDLYSNFTYTTILCDADGSCSQPRPFAIDGYEVWNTQIFKRSEDYVAVYRTPSLNGFAVNFLTWKSVDGGATWTKYGDDFLGFGQFLSPPSWGYYKEGLAGVNILCFPNEDQTEYNCYLKGFRLEIGSGSVKWGNAEIPFGKKSQYLYFDVGNNGKVFAVWISSEGGRKISGALYDIEKDEFSEVDGVELDIDGDISVVKPFVNDAGYCIAIEYIVARAENVGPQQTKTIWGCNKW